HLLYPYTTLFRSSRVMNQIVDDEHIEAAQQLRTLMAIYEENSELIQIGAYKHGTDRNIDKAILYHPKIQSYLKQAVFEYEPLDHSIEQMKVLLNGGID